MAKAKVKTTVEAPTVNAVVEDFNTNGSGSEFRLLPIDRLFPSLTNPRKRFPDASIEELAGSIREKGILEPLIVRGPQTAEDRKLGPIEAFEIVCGERRYRAAKTAGLGIVPCLVRVLTDEEVLDIQIHENLHREDVHPMDEALGYKFLMEKIGCEVAEVAARVGKSEAYVLGRLKLNALIPEVQKDLEDGLLPVGHALEIAKFAPDSQLKLLNEGAFETDDKWDGKAGEWIYKPIKSKPKILADFREWIAEKILWRLAKAPFDRKATNLRPDGLACVACPNRTGANALLFDKGTGNNDSCLDPACWNNKATAHVKITRERLAHEASVSIDEIPLIDTGSYSGRDGALGYDNYVLIVKGKVESWNTKLSNKPCDKSITTVDVSRDQYGKLATVCLRETKCKVHFGKGGSATARSAGKNDAIAEAAEKIKKLERKEELFDIAVGERVRHRVMRLAADHFAKNAELGPDLDNILPELLAKLWLTATGGIDGATRGHLVAPIMAAATDSEDGFGNFGYEQPTVADNFRKRLSEAHQYRSLVLFGSGNTGAMYYDGYSSQSGVRKIAEEYGIDYTMLDAQVRVEVAQEKAKKHLKLFKAYLAMVEAGKKNAKIPRPYAPSYKAPA